jgi:hypothetical protein
VGLRQILELEDRQTRPKRKTVEKFWMDREHFKASGGDPVAIYGNKPWRRFCANEKNPYLLQGCLVGAA